MVQKLYMMKESKSVMKKYLKNFLRYKYLLTELVKKISSWSIVVLIWVFYGRWSSHCSRCLYWRWCLVHSLVTTMNSILYISCPDDCYIPFFSSGTKSGLRAVSGNAAMIKKVYVPKYIYVLSTVISNFVTFLISLVVLVGVGAVLHVQPTIYVVQAIVPLFILLIMTTGISMILATLNVFFRDIEYIWSVFTMLIMYASAIFYQPDRVINTGNGWIFGVNPYICVFPTSVRQYCTEHR